MIIYISNKLKSNVTFLDIWLKNSAPAVQLQFYLKGIMVITMEEQSEPKSKETPSVNITWVEKYRPGALQDLISHEGKQ